MTKILHLEDDFELSKLMATAFTGKGFEVKSCYSAEEGLAAILNYEPNIILTDMMMPGMTGLDFVKEYYSKYLSTIRAPVELMTGYAPDAMISEFKQYGQSIYDFLKLEMVFDPMIKPVSLNTVQERMTAVDLSQK